jgi:hypothetical protein
MAQHDAFRNLGRSREVETSRGPVEILGETGHEAFLTAVKRVHLRCMEAKKGQLSTYRCEYKQVGASWTLDRRHWLWIGVGVCSWILQPLPQLKALFEARSETRPPGQ